MLFIDHPIKIAVLYCSICQKNKMGRRQHGQDRKRKRPTIDLNSLSKKHRKQYREEVKVKPKHSVDEEKEAIQENTKKQTVVEQDPDVSSSDEESNPYQQLVATLSEHPGGSEDSSDEGGDLDDENDEDDDDVEMSDSGDSEAEEEEEVNTGENEKSRVKSTASRDGGEADGSGEDDEDDVLGEDDENEDEEEDFDLDQDEDSTLQDTDPFLIHFETDLEDKVAEELGSCKACQKKQLKIPGVGEVECRWSHDQYKPRIAHRKERDLSKQHVKKSLCTNLEAINHKLGHSVKHSQDGLTAFEAGLFSIVNNYQDILYTNRNSENQEEIRLVYCIHALNHVLKTRKRVISNNMKMKHKGDNSDQEEYRDQGLTRPKVLILLPFRDSAKRVVDIFMQLLSASDKSTLANKARFFEEYGLDKKDEPKKMGRKPDDFGEIFNGNIDDHFRIGIGIAKKTLKLYTKFYSADIILASPLGLRMLIGTEGDKEREYDFLNSIELLILDQTDIFMMQNWDHVLHIMKHLHLQPRESHGVDFSRVRMWTLNGWSKYYRQSLVFSSVPVPEVSALFNKHCHNYAGKCQFIREPSSGTICQIASQVPQVFHRVETTSNATAPDDRFDFFTKKIFPHHTETMMNQTLIFIPSYFDFVRLRNYFKREEINFVHVNEYAEDKNVYRARDLFFHRKVPFMLFTERFHFYKRYKIRGIRHIVFYGLPQYAHLYSEMVNMLTDAKRGIQAEDQTCTVIYTKYDALRLVEVVGSSRAAKMLHSTKNVHMFVTGEDG